jgi:hypothetical protein
MANAALASVSKNAFGVGGQKRLKLRLNRLRDQLACPRISVSGSSIAPFCRRAMTLVSLMA